MPIVDHLDMLEGLTQTLQDDNPDKAGLNEAIEYLLEVQETEKALARAFKRAKNEHEKFGPTPDVFKMVPAIESMCRTCIYDENSPGTWRMQVQNCTSKECPLHDVRLDAQHLTKWMRRQ